MPTVEPDYLELWKELVSRGTGRVLSRFEVNEVAAAFDRRVRRKSQSGANPLFKRVADILEPGDTVLDIGAGTGGWAIPLAAVVSRVTTVEPAAAMSDILLHNAREAGVLDKIDLVSATWEGADVGIHDVAISAHSSYQSVDFAAFVRKMEAHARRLCYLAMRLIPVDGVIPELSMMIHGSRHDSANFIVAYNALYQMGIYANVFIEEQTRTWTDETVEAALARAKRHLHIEDDHTHDDIVMAVLKRRLVFREGVYHWPDRVSTALVSWKMHPDPNVDTAPLT